LTSLHETACWQRTRQQAFASYVSQLQRALCPPCLWHIRQQPTAEVKSPGDSWTPGLRRTSPSHTTCLDRSRSSLVADERYRAQATLSPSARAGIRQRRLCYRPQQLHLCFAVDWWPVPVSRRRSPLQRWNCGRGRLGCPLHSTSLHTHCACRRCGRPCTPHLD
jgi:hypothetical protein